MSRYRGNINNGLHSEHVRPLHLPRSAVAFSHHSLSNFSVGCRAHQVFRGVHSIAHGVGRRLVYQSVSDAAASDFVLVPSTRIRRGHCWIHPAPPDRNDSVLRQLLGTGEKTHRGRAFVSHVLQQRRTSFHLGIQRKRKK